MSKVNTGLKYIPAGLDIKAAVSYAENRLGEALIPATTLHHWYKHVSKLEAQLAECLMNIRHIGDRNTNKDFLHAANYKMLLEETETQLAECQRDRDALRECLQKNIDQERKASYRDYGHHCIWRVIVDAIVQRSKKALAAPIINPPVIDSN